MKDEALEEMRYFSRPTCDDCGEHLNQCECDPLAEMIEDVSNTLTQLDRLAEAWGDEGVFRRCRDSLREAIVKAKRKRESGDQS
jgi:hypothetical protein